MTDQIIQMQALHDNDDAAGRLAVQAAEQGMVEPVVGIVALGFRQGFIRFQRIVDDDKVATATGEHTTH